MYSNSISTVKDVKLCMKPEEISIKKDRISTTRESFIVRDINENTINDDFYRSDETTNVFSKFSDLKVKDDMLVDRDRITRRNGSDYELGVSCSFPLPLSMIEVEPIINENDSLSFSFLSPSLLKLYLLEYQSKNPLMRIKWYTKSEEKNANKKKSQTVCVKGILHCYNSGDNRERKHSAVYKSVWDIPSLIDPSQPRSKRISCRLHGYCVSSDTVIPISTKTNNEPIELLQEVYLHDSTYIMITLPIISSFSDLLTNNKLSLSSHSNHDLRDHYCKASFLYNHYNDTKKNILSNSILSRFDTQTINSLALRIQLQFQSEAYISSTQGSNVRNTKVKFQKNPFVQNAVKSFGIQYINSKRCNLREDHMFKNTSNKLNKNNETTTQLEGFGEDRAITIYNSNPDTLDKTQLLCEILVSIVKCKQIYMINPGLLFAKYGNSHADVALQSILHDLVLSAAHKQEPISIILNPLEGFIPSPETKKTKKERTVGDPSQNTLNSMSSYLSNLVHSLKKNKFFPFPSSNGAPLHNFGSDDSKMSYVELPVKLCLIGITTCESNHLDIVTTATDKNDNINPTLNILGGKFYLPYNNFNNTPDLSNSKRKNDVNSKIESNANLSQLSKSISYYDETVGGNEQAKIALENALALNPKIQKILTLYNLSPPTGVLLYGPPGTGKTLLARATAAALQQSFSSSPSSADKSPATFFSLQASSIIRSEIGNSEKMIVSIFDLARRKQQEAKSPCVVIFIDEFEALFTSRSGGGGGGGKLATILLQCMDDVTSWRKADMLSSRTKEDLTASTTSNNLMNGEGGGRIVVLGATNAPWLIDKAFLRPGRFDRAVHVGLPTVEERKSILNVHVQKMKVVDYSSVSGNVTTDDDRKSTIVKEICQEMAKECIGYSGADLQALCRAAAVRSLNDDTATPTNNINNNSTDDPGGEKSKFYTHVVTLEHFKLARQFDVQASCNIQQVNRIASWKSSS